MRPFPRVFARIGGTLLGVAAAAGVLVSAAALVASSPPGRRLVASALVRAADGAIAGRIALDGIALLPHGAMEAEGLRLLDPEGREVLRIRRVRLFPEVARVGAGVLGLSVEIEDPEVDLSAGPDGRLALVRALSPPGPPREDEGGDGFRWSVRLSRVAVRGGLVRAPGNGGVPAFAASELFLDGRGALGRGGARVEARLRGRLDAPFVAPLALDLAASSDGGRLLVAVLDATVGGSHLEAVAEGDLAHATGRAAVIRLGVDRRQAATFVAAAAEVGGDLVASGFVASDGRVATAAAHVRPSGKDGSGRADLAAALRLGAGRRAMGIDVRAEAVDPSRLLSVAPPGRVTLSARGAASGSGLADLRARLSLSLAPSVVRGVPLGPAEVEASAREGEVRVARLEADLPGAKISGSGRWRREGPVAGRLRVQASDLARLGAAVEAIAGTTMPPIAGSARAELDLSGTAAAPSLRGEVSAPAASLGGLSVAGLSLGVEASGPLRTGTGRFAGTASRMAAGWLEARAVDLRGAVEHGGADVALTATVPAFGKDPVELRGKGRFGPARETLVVEDLLVAWPGSRFDLAAPATVRLAGPSVDRLELASGTQRVALEGGREPDGRLDARLEVSRLDLASVPRGVLPDGLGLSGEVSLDARVRGRAELPLVEATIEVVRGAVRGLDGVEATARIRWDGEASRLSAEGRLSRSKGVSAEASADLPLPLRRARPDAPVAARLRIQGLLVEEALRVAGLSAPAAGRLDLSGTLEGTAGAPSLRIAARLDDGVLGDLDRLALAASIEDPGERARLRADLAREGSVLATVDASVPLGTAALISDPGASLPALLHAPLEASIEVPGADLASLAGMAGLPPEVRGRLTAAARMGGTLAAPRGEASLDVADGAVAGYAGVVVRVEASASGEATRLAATVALGKDEVVRLAASLGAPPERLFRRNGRETVQVQADLSIAHASLAGAAGPDVPLSGTVEGRASVSGTLGAPVVEASLSGSGVALGGRPLGDLAAEARYRARRAEGEVRLEAASGGTLAVEASLGVDLAPGAPEWAPGGAPASIRVRAEALDLGFLAAVAPRAVRSASGKIAIDLAGEGPLRSLRPRGTVRLEGGRVATVDWGEWTAGALDVALTDDAVEVTRLEARSGTGRLEASFSLRGLSAGDRSARLEGRAAASALTLVRGGQEVATVDGTATARGKLESGRLDAVVEIARTTVRLPKQLPRDLQSLDRRTDIVVGRAPTRRPASPAAKPAPATPRFVEARVHVVASHRIEVRSESPRASVDLVVDVTLEIAGGQVFAEGAIDVVRGEVEPISGRNFAIEHGRVQFTGGPPRAAVLEVRAVYENPAATVTVSITGPLTRPEIRLSSDPPMDDGAIAMLIATGQGEFRPGTAGVGTLTAEDAGRAALGAVVTQVFKGLVAEKLPLDSVALDATTLRAGKYVGDKVYVGYVRRFDAKPEEGEATDEVRLQYRISRRWRLEASAGTAQNYGASLIWSMDY